MIVLIDVSFCRTRRGGTEDLGLDRKGGGRSARQKSGFILLFGFRCLPFCILSSGLVLVFPWACVLLVFFFNHLVFFFN